MKMRPGEVLITSAQGGGGFGDPLDRAPEAVLADALEERVSRVGARDSYGVVLVETGDAPSLDAAATAELRNEMRRRRVSGRAPRARNYVRRGRRLSSHFEAIATEDGGEIIHCAHCGEAVGRVGEPLYPRLVLAEAPAGERFPLTARYEGNERFRIRHFYCPGCATQVDVHVCVADENLLEAMEIHAGDAHRM
jgi:N-methylhydantoinase B